MPSASVRHIDQVQAVIDQRAPPRTDGLVQDSWMRSAKLHGLDPASRAAPNILTASELRRSQEAASLLIQVARVELD